MDSTLAGLAGEASGSVRHAGGEGRQTDLGECYRGNGGSYPAVSSLPSQPEDATQRMSAAARGDANAANQLLPLVYDQLRRAAQRQIAGEGARRTLSATGLVHEAHLKLVGPREVEWAGREHFYAAAAEARRRILIDRALARNGRNPGARNARLRAMAIAGLSSEGTDEDSDGILAFDDAVGRLDSVDTTSGGSCMPRTSSTRPRFSSAKRWRSSGRQGRQCSTLLDPVCGARFKPGVHSGRKEP